ncbi:2'-5' RNA ligase family protein [Kribbella antibiotica]|uniref:2'-5' RNA ligase family protein n=1 Tax=Kribbella antibiotica TaxID=190195 RepID=A0A4R4YPY9_9ACTN|nr:2'-5' RNA ligase family protein [Kribbella antibiotica]TDD47173.1 2'-5' RNA ligase family protein [Kribbella antibiotica]
MTDEVRDHWYWRPGWRQGRSFYTWHITFRYAAALATLRSSYEPLLASMPELTPVPRQWLHLTLQGVGFADKLSPAELEDIVAATRCRLTSVAPFGVTVGPAVVDTESLQLPVHPVGDLRELRTTLRDAVNEVWGEDSLPALPDLNPHISLGYWNRTAPAAPLRDRVAEFGEKTTQLYINEVSLIDLNRDQLCYQWTPYVALPLGRPAHV